MTCAPDSIQPVLGWRVWSVIEVDGRLVLSSLVYETAWLPGHAAAACCRRPLAALPWGRLPLHEPPNVDCVCGIYAVATAGQAVPYLRSRVEHGPLAVHRVLGRVSLWGRIVEGRAGWRAARAYPERIVVPPLERGGLARRVTRRTPRVADVLRALAAYGVPVESADSIVLEPGVRVRL